MAVISRPRPPVTAVHLFGGLYSMPDIFVLESRAILSRSASACFRVIAGFNRPIAVKPG